MKENVVRVVVRAGARAESLTISKKGVYEIEVRERAEENQANRRVIELVAAHFGVAHKAVRIISGHHRPSKSLRIHLPA